MGEVQLVFDEVIRLFFSHADSKLRMKGQGPTYWSMANLHLKNVHDRFEITDGPLLGITTDNASSNYSMTRELQSTLEASGIVWPAVRNHIPCMVHIIQWAIGAFMSSLGGKGHTKSWEAHDRDQQFGENESIHIRKSQRLRKEGNTRINMVSAMKPGLAKIIKKVRISWCFESLELDPHTTRMLDVLITLTPGRRNEFIHCQIAKVRIAVLPTMDVKTRCNSTREMFEHAYQLWEFTWKWLQNLNYSDYRPLFTTQDEWTMVKYVIEVLRSFRYWTLWMSKRHTVTLHHVTTVNNDMFDHMDGVMRPFTKKKTQWKEDLFFAVKLPQQKLSKYYAEVTPTTGMLRISAHSLNPFRSLWSFRMWDERMDINPEDETSYTTQYQEAF